MMTAQDKINQMQSIYKQWLALNQKLEQAEKDWQQSVHLMKQMEQFYFDGEWGDLYEQIEQGLDVDLTTDGEYSVMSEDTLWNAFHQQQTMLWQQMRFAMKQLDKDMPEFYSDNE